MNSAFEEQQEYLNDIDIAERDYWETFDDWDDEQHSLTNIYNDYERDIFIKLTQWWFIEGHLCGRELQDQYIYDQQQKLWRKIKKIGWRLFLMIFICSVLAVGYYAYR